MRASVRQVVMGETTMLRFPGMPAIKGVGPVIVAQPAEYEGRHAVSWIPLPKVGRRVYVPRHAVDARYQEATEALTGAR